MNEKKYLLLKSGRILSFAGLICLFLAAGSGPQDTPRFPSGSTQTLLSDGRWLVLGGQGNNGPIAAAQIWDLSTGLTTSLSGGLRHPRAWHTATMIPDGTVFIFGGIGSDGKVVSEAELFDPDTQTFEILPSTGLTPRSNHTATVLTDGILLVAGGLSADGKALKDAALWDFQESAALPLTLKLSTERYNHTATLLADGRVLLFGGLDKNGDSLDDGDLFDPALERFSSVPASEIQNLRSQNHTPQVVASLPANGAVDVAIDSFVAVRFSTPMRVENVSSDTVILSGPNGLEPVRVVPAEGGMLAFITPETLLAPGATYTVTLNGPIDHNGFLLPVTSFSFTAESSAAGTSSSTGTTPGSSSMLSQTQDFKSGANDDDGFVWKGALKDGKPHSPWQDLPPLQAEQGVTALAGQVLDLKGNPLANVALEIEYSSYEITATTDDTGRFLLKNITPGWRDLIIDGRRGHNPNSQAENETWGYGLFEYGLQVAQGQNILPFTIWLPKIDGQHAVAIASPTNSDIVITTPHIKDLEVRVPRGTVIKDYEGDVVRELSITAIPQDRPPFPLPANVITPAFFTIQPGLAYVYGSEGVMLVYPNYHDIPQPAGARLNFWHYDPDGSGWYIYGQGTVTQDGKQVVPDPGVRIYEFTGAMINGPDSPGSPTKCKGVAGCTGGEPVDLSTGTFIMEKTDLFLPDVMPLKLTRTYVSSDVNARAFGAGMTHPYAMFLWSALQYQQADLILPNQGRIHYVRTSSGTGFADAVFEHRGPTASCPTCVGSPTTFYGSIIRWNGNGWDLTVKDGTVYVFGENAPLQAIRDRNGNQITITHNPNSAGIITQITSPNGRWISFTYEAGNRIIQAKDNLGRTVTYTYNGGRLATVTDPNGGVTTYTYDASNRMATIKDPRNIVFLTNEYYADGKVKKQTQADNTTFQFAYVTDGSGNVTQTDLTDPRGNIRRVAFNTDGQILSDTLAVGTADAQTTSYVLEPSTNLVLSATDALNRKISYTYDAMGNVASITRLADTPDAVMTTYSYDPVFNQVATVTDPLNHTTTLGYDATGNLTTVTNPLNQTTTTAYNTAGQPISITDSLTNVTQFTYELGDLVAITDPLGNSTGRIIDPVGRLLSVTNPLGNMTQYDYDTLNRLTKVTDPLNGQTQFGYDPNGNLLSVTDAKNQATSYTYNNMDRLATRIDPLLHGESYVYDSNGNLSQFTDRKSQATAYTYDLLNRRTQMTYADLSTTAYTYDAGNRLTQVVDSISGTITRAYDGLDRMTSETTPQGSVSYTYDTTGRRASMTVTGQPAISYTYDNANRLTQITQGSSIVSFAYDAAGRRTSLTLPNGILVEYAYDVASRVTDITYKQGTNVLGSLTYEYDKAGNRTKVGGTWARTGIPNAVTTANYNSANQQTGLADKTMTFDNNGNLTSLTDPSGTTIYAWSPRNQLASISGPGVSASFVYDGLGRREKKTINSSLIEFLYDGVNPVQETSGATVLANTLTGLGIDEPFSRTDVQAGTTSHVLSDALGSVIAATELSGNVQTEYSYEPFGKTSISGVSDSNTYQYTGRENDGTGLYQYRNRFYHPGLQRFISEDPIEFFGGDTNLYAYVVNSPTNFIDPSGLTWQTNWNFFWDWELGRGPRNRFYGMNSVETWEMAISPGAQTIRQNFYNKDCQSIKRGLEYGTLQAYWDTWWNPMTADWSSTAWQVGGFAGASAINNRNGTVTFTIPNTAGRNSFYLHVIPNRSSPTGPESNIYQTFQWTEPLGGRSCGCK